MGICAVIYGVTAFVGFKTFGLNAEGTILKNYSINDWPINFAKLGIVCSLIASYGIMFAALRESSLSLLKEVSGHWCGDFNYFDLIWRQDVLTTVLVSTITLIAVMCQDSGLVDGFVGALCGNAVIYIIPGLLYAASIHVFFTRRRGNLQSIATSLGLVVFGVVLIIGGVFCVVFYELPKVTTQFKDVAIYSDKRMSAPDAFLLGGAPHHLADHPASRYILMALVLAPLASAWAAFMVSTKYAS
jgi:amino acid permease